MYDINQSLEFIIPICPDNHSYIYFLLNSYDEVIYVGQTKCLVSRLAAHVNDKTKSGIAKIRFITVPKGRVNEIEAELIIKHHPKFNKGIPTNTKFGSLQFFIDKNSCLKGKLGKLKNALKELNIKPIDGFYELKDLKKAMNLVIGDLT